MTAPQIPAAWGQPAPAPVPQPQYAPPPQQQQYQQPPAQQYAPQQGYQAPPVQYGPPPQQQYQYAPPVNGYGQQPQQYGPPQPPPPPLAKAESLDDYLNQQQGGANYWKWDNPGDYNIGVVAREVTKHDIRQKTFEGRPVTRPDGSPIWELQLPVINQDGTESVWGVSGRDKTALENAVRNAGGPANGIPPKGAALRVTHTHRPTHKGPDWSGKGTPPKIKAVEVVLNGSAPAAAPPQAPASQPIPAQHPEPQQYAQPGPMQQYQQPPAQPQQQMAPPPQQYQQPAPAPQQYAQQPPAQGAPPQLPPDAQAQFAHLLGGAAPAQ
jgi:hypothetical protein